MSRTIKNEAFNSDKINVFLSFIGDNDPKIIDEGGDGPILSIIKNLSSSIAYCYYFYTPDVVRKTGIARENNALKTKELSVKARPGITVKLVVVDIKQPNSFEALIDQALPKVLETFEEVEQNLKDRSIHYCFNNTSSTPAMREFFRFIPILGITGNATFSYLQIPNPGATNIQENDHPMKIIAKKYPKLGIRPERINPSWLTEHYDALRNAVGSVLELRTIGKNISMDDWKNIRDPDTLHEICAGTPDLTTFSPGHMAGGSTGQGLDRIYTDNTILWEILRHHSTIRNILGKLNYQAEQMSGEIQQFQNPPVRALIQFTPHSKDLTHAIENWCKEMKSLNVDQGIDFKPGTIDVELYDYLWINPWSVLDAFRIFIEDVKDTGILKGVEVHAYEATFPEAIGSSLDDMVQPAICRLQTFCTNLESIKDAKGNRKYTQERIKQYKTKIEERLIGNSRLLCIALQQKFANHDASTEKWTQFNPTRFYNSWIDKKGQAAPRARELIQKGGASLFVHGNHSGKNGNDFEGMGFWGNQQNSTGSILGTTDSQAKPLKNEYHFQVWFVGVPCIHYPYRRNDMDSWDGKFLSHPVILNAKFAKALWESSLVTCSEATIKEDVD